MRKWPIGDVRKRSIAVGRHCSSGYARCRPVHDSQASYRPIAIIELRAPREVLGRENGIVEVADLPGATDERHLVNDCPLAESAAEHPTKIGQNLTFVLLQSPFDLIVHDVVIYLGEEADDFNENISQQREVDTQKGGDSKRGE